MKIQFSPKVKLDHFYAMERLLGFFTFSFHLDLRSYGQLLSLFLLERETVGKILEFVQRIQIVS